MSELDLLREAITNENEAERDGVKYVFMDSDTVYRFANNRMKKVSKSLINKALKTRPEPENEPKRNKKKINRKQPIIEEEEEEAEFEPENEVLNEMKPKRKRSVEQSERIKKMNKTNNKSPSQSLPFELSEYYENKYRLEHMTQEMEHLNQKITKLKHYKHLINKLTGGEIEDLPNTTQTQPQPQPQDNTTNKTINYDIFDF